MKKSIKIIIGIASILIGLACFKTSIPVAILLILAGAAWLAFHFLVYPAFLAKNDGNRNAIATNTTSQPAPKEQPANITISENAEFDLIPFCDDEKIRTYKYKDNVCIIKSEENPYPYVKNEISKGNRYINFVQEPENPYDNKAVAIHLNGKRIGYVFRGKKQDMINDYIDKGYSIMGNISEYSPDRISYFIGFFKPKSECESDEVKYNNEKFSELFMEGSVLFVTYNGNSEKCSISTEYEENVFELPKNFTKYINIKNGTVAEVGENAESLIFYK